MRLCFVDTETFSEVSLKTHGTGAYAPASEVMIVTYAFETGPAKLWDVTSGTPIPADLAEALEDPDVTLVAHNAFFDRSVLRYQGWCPDIPIERWRCTMAQAYAHGLPGALGILGDIFGITQQKKEGRDYIHLFCKPRPKNQKLRRATRKTHPIEWQRFCEYAVRDTEALRELYYKLPTWNYPDNEFELRLWFLDQKINDRGVAVDLELCEAARKAADRAKRKLNGKTADLTDGEVGAATQRDKLLAHILEAHGVDLPDMKATTLERRLNDETLPEAVHELLRVRLASSMTSQTKYKTAIDAAVAGRVYGMLQWCGAQRTGRWAGRVLQPQNFVRTKWKQWEVEEFIAALKANVADLLHSPKEVMEGCAQSLRGMFMAGPGKKLVVSDLSNIEGRVLPWLGDEQWKLQVFRDYDTILGYDEEGEPIRKGPDNYKAAYASAFGKDPGEVDGQERQRGKGMELSMGYYGGVGAFLNIAATYKLDLQEMTDAAFDLMPEHVMSAARKAWKWAQDKRRTFGLDEKVYLVCDCLKRLWRTSHPKLSAKCYYEACEDGPCEHAGLWQNYEKAFRAAVLNEGTVYKAGRCQFVRTGNWLRIRLPSGRQLCYPNPRVAEDGTLSYMGINQYSKKWQRLKTYSGKIAENIDQGVSRDVMAVAMFRAEAAGYWIILTIHDEIVAEVPDTDEYSEAGLSALLAANDDWNEGLPLAAGGFEGPRYRKE